MTSIADAPPKAELAAALADCRQAFWGVAATSFVTNILALSGSLFMLQVYDRVIPSRSFPTLVALTLLVVLLYAFQHVLDALRGRILVRIGAAMDQRLSRRVVSNLVEAAARPDLAPTGLQPLRDLDQVRGFMSGLGPAALMDLPWLPVYVAVCFVFHPSIGIMALVGAVIVTGLAILTDVLARKRTWEIARQGNARQELAESTRRNAEVIRALGMNQRMTDRWADVDAAYRRGNAALSDLVNGLTSFSKTFRMALQSLVLALGAYLVISQEATGGIMIASSILVARALAPVDQAISYSRAFVGARQSWHRLEAFLARSRGRPEPLTLPLPSRELSVAGGVLVPPGTQKIVANDLNFTLKAGQALGIIGPSGSGKSSIARALVGVWPVARGEIRLDGALMDQWDRERLGAAVGYVPQDVELFAGSVAQNISRFQLNPSPDAVLAAAKAADVHEMILRLPEGYETQIGEGGALLSAGQRQRVALARALYGNPFLVVLDEPNSNLDMVGEKALSEAILGVRARGGIVVVISHRETVLGAVDVLMTMVGGQVEAMGPRERVLDQLRQRAVAAQQPALKVIKEAPSGA